jgi:hypothetical protein
MFSALLALKLQLANTFSPARSAISRLPRIGGLASIPSRAADLEEVLSHILPQVERLHLFLHGYPEIPAAAAHPKIVAYLASADTPYRSSGKFYGLTRETEPCLYFCFDDDIRYHKGHVERLVAALRRYGGNVIVGLHGNKYRQPVNFVQADKTYRFQRGYALPHQVDVLGTGTVGFCSENLRLDPTTWPYGDMDDIMVAIAAERQGLRRIAIARPRHSVTPISEKQADSLWVRALGDSSRQDEQLNILLGLSGARRGRAS